MVEAFSENEIHTAIPIVILGHGVAKKLFKNVKKALDKRVKIGSNSYTVIGVVEESSEGRGFTNNNNVYVPMLMG